MRTSIATALVLSLVITGSAWAQCSESSKKSAKAQASCQATCDKAKTTRLASGSCCGNCGGGKTCDPADCWASSCPKVQYKVAGETLCCPQNAEILAKAKNEKVSYMVAGQEFCDKGDAMATLAKLLNERLEQMTTVSYVVGDETMQCGMSASKMAKSNGTDVRYRVASFTFAEQAQAEQAAKLAREAADSVKMVSVVDGKEYCCSKTAAKVAADSGKQCEYKVAGQKGSTCCQTTAEVQLAQAKIEAAAKAMQQSSAGS